MVIIIYVEIYMVDFKFKVLRIDVIQSFQSQEILIVCIIDVDGVVGVGYIYMIGIGGLLIVVFLEYMFVLMLIGCDVDVIQKIWNDLLFVIYVMVVGVIILLFLVVIDMVLWDLWCKKVGLFLFVMVGGVWESVLFYIIEGGWFYIEIEVLIDDVLVVQDQGFCGLKIKIGKLYLSEDCVCLIVLCEVVGLFYEIMVDVNQLFSLLEVIWWVKVFEEVGVGWFEELLLVDDIGFYV